MRISLAVFLSIFTTVLAAAAQDSSVEYKDHFLKRGESPWSVAKGLGLKSLQGVVIGDLGEYKPTKEFLEDCTRLHVGARIRIPVSKSAVVSLEIVVPAEKPATATTESMTAQNKSLPTSVAVDVYRGTFRQVVKVTSPLVSAAPSPFVEMYRGAKRTLHRIFDPLLSGPNSTPQPSKKVIKLDYGEEKVNERILIAGLPKKMSKQRRTHPLLR